MSTTLVEDEYKIPHEDQLQYELPTDLKQIMKTTWKMSLSPKLKPMIDTEISPKYQQMPVNADT